MKQIISIVVVTLGALSCSEAHLFNSTDDTKADAAHALGASEYEVALRTTERGTYVVAELGGGGAVNANRSARGPWETFTLRDLNGGELKDGDEVALRSNDGHWLSAEGGGGAGLSAKGSGPNAWERFVLSRDAQKVTLRTVNGHYLVAEGGGGDVVNANRTAAGPWETFVLELDGAATPPATTGGGVRADDAVLLPPVATGAVLGTVTGYEMNSHCPFSEQGCERPLYLKYDRDDPEWWDTLVQELLASRVNVVMAHGRGCFDPDSGDQGNGNMCPRLLRHLVAAIERAGANDVMRLGMFDDTGAYQGTRTQVDGLPETTRFDLADRTSWRFFWDHNMRIWFDTVPRQLWYRKDGRPVVAFWTLSSYFFSNQRGNGSALLRDLRAKFLARYGEDPLFIVDSTWINDDPTIDAEGADSYVDFSPENRGGAFRGGPADIARLREPAGWYVGWTEGGEALTFREVALPCGTWRVTARVASANGGQKLHVELGGQALPAVEVPAGGMGLVHLGEVQLRASRNDVNVVFDSGGVDLDWIFLKRSSSACQ